MRSVVLLLLAVLLTGCAAPKKPIASQPAAALSPDAGYIDLQPGWRLRVITPLLKSGGYRVRLSEEKTEGSNLTLKVDSDFIGHETSYYDVRQTRSGLRVAFRSAEVTTDGKTKVQSKPAAALFQLPRNSRHVRLLFLRRVSTADHDMAVIGARNTVALAAATERIQSVPDGGCKQVSRATCSFVPSGIAVRAEMQRTDNGTGVWVPAR
jgi:hypothetical protein